MYLEHRCDASRLCEMPANTVDCVLVFLISLQSQMINVLVIIWLYKTIHYWSWHLHSVLSAMVSHTQRHECMQNTKRPHNLLHARVEIKVSLRLVSCKPLSQQALLFRTGGCTFLIRPGFGLKQSSLAFFLKGWCGRVGCSEFWPFGQRSPPHPPLK